jgi:hypothetical protein
VRQLFLAAETARRNAVAIRLQAAALRQEVRLMSEERAARARSPESPESLTVV